MKIKSIALALALTALNSTAAIAETNINTISDPILGTERHEVTTKLPITKGKYGGFVMVGSIIDGKNITREYVAVAVVAEANTIPKFTAIKTRNGSIPVTSSWQSNINCDSSFCTSLMEGNFDATPTELLELAKGVDTPAGVYSGTAVKLPFTLDPAYLQEHIDKVSGLTEPF